MKIIISEFTKKEVKSEVWESDDLAGIGRVEIGRKLAVHSDACDGDDGNPAGARVIPQSHAHFPNS